VAAAQRGYDFMLGWFADPIVKVSRCADALRVAQGSRLPCLACNVCCCSVVTVLTTSSLWVKEVVTVLLLVCVQGSYPQSMIDTVGSRLPQFTAEEQAILANSTDFIALNYYFPWVSAPGAASLATRHRVRIERIINQDVASYDLLLQRSGFPTCPLRPSRSSNAIVAEPRPDQPWLRHSPPLD
jgi:hypothetical protein